MTRRIVHWNGALVPEEEARISPFDRGLLLGDGVFETLRAYDGRPFQLDDHLARLRRSCEIVRIPFPADLAARVDAVLQANGLADAALRITLTRGPGGRGASAIGAGPPTVLVTATPVAVPPETYERGVRLATATRRRVPPSAMDASVKSINYLVHVLARMEAEDAGADDALFVDADGHVVEATTANVFARFGDRLVTPPLASGCLPGATRALVLRLAPDAGLRAEEAPLARDALFDADEIILTASVTEVAPAVSVDGRLVGGGKPGAAAQRLHALYRQRARGVV